MSQCKEMTDIGCSYNFMSNNKLLSYYASLPVVAEVINSNSIVECEIHIYSLKAHEITILLRVKTQPDIALLTLILVIQLESQYPSSTTGKLV